MYLYMCIYIYIYIYTHTYSGTHCVRVERVHAQEGLGTMAPPGERPYYSMLCHVILCYMMVYYNTTL